MFLFCCLIFCVVWAFGVSLFLLFGRERGPHPNSQKKMPLPKQQKKTTRPFRAFCFFCCLGGWACYCFSVWAVTFFFAVWAGGVFCFLLFGRGRVFFLLFGPVLFFLFFSVWAGGIFFFCYLGGGHVFFCCLGGGREFTHLPVCLACLQATPQQKRPNSKKKNTGSSL